MRLIAFEGLDKAGKHHQVKYLEEALRHAGYTVETLSFPRYDTAIGRALWDHLRGTATLDPITFQMVQVADKQEAQHWIEQLEERGYDYLLIDRYIASVIAYGYADDIRPSFLDDMMAFLLSPDVEIYLDIPPEISVERTGKHGPNDRFEADVEHLKQAAEGYRVYYQHMAVTRPIWIDGTRGEADIHHEILTQLSERKLAHFS